MTEILTPKAKKAAIVGFASSSRELAPFTDESWDIIGVNHLYRHIPRWSVWYEMHPKDHFSRNLVRDGVVQAGNEHYDWLKAQPGPESPDFKPIYMQQHFDDIPASVPWPREEINDYLEKKWGCERDYYTSSISEMLALAIMQGYEEIGLWGIDMVQDEEYFYQRAGAEALIYLARGAGIKVHVPRQSALCKANYVYGYSEPAADAKHLQPLADRFAAMGQEFYEKHMHATFGIHTCNGGLELTDLYLKLVAEGKELGQVHEVMKERREEVRKQRDHHIIASKVYEAQKIAFETSGTLTKHFGRGGSLLGGST